MRTHSAGGKPRNPRPVILEGLREVAASLRYQIGVYYDATRKFDTTDRMIVPTPAAELPENDPAVLRDTAQRAERLAAYLRGIAAYAREQAEIVERRLDKEGSK